MLPQTNIVSPLHSFRFRFLLPLSSIIYGYAPHSSTRPSPRDSSVSMFRDSFTRRQIQPFSRPLPPTRRTVPCRPAIETEHCSITLTPEATLRFATKRSLILQSTAKQASFCRFARCYNMSHQKRNNQNIVLWLETLRHADLKLDFADCSKKLVELFCIICKNKLGFVVGCKTKLSFAEESQGGVWGYCGRQQRCCNTGSGSVRGYF